MSIDELIAIIEDQDSPEFARAAAELAKRGSEASPAGAALARALEYPRRDSTEAGVALVSLGPAADSAVPYLIPALTNERADVRVYALFSLGSIGGSSTCAIPKIAPLLWDQDGGVRATAAGALAAISGINLVEDSYQLKPNHPRSWVYEEPEGSISGAAREWWKNSGQFQDWNEEVSRCDPLSG